jgi:putative chitinase
MINNPNKNYFTMYTKLKSNLPENVFIEVPKVVLEFKIDTPLRLCHFLAQCAHESGNWRFIEENLNYSSAALQSVFRKYFPTEALANQYARKPQNIANLVYGNRMGNGDESSNDGWNYRGRGYIQLTGKNNYSQFNTFVEDDVISNPQLVSEKYPLLSAAWFWSVNNLNNIADQGESVDVIRQVTRRVNGGFHGIDDRIAKFNGYWSKFS